MARGRGGNDTTPRDPAPVSGPGALSRRTDGGAGQPLRAPTGLPHGERGALLDQQRAAPLAAEDPSIPGGRPGAAGGAEPAAGAFGPSARPFEDATAGLGLGPEITPEDPDALTRDLYSIYPHPDIARLLG